METFLMLIAIVTFCLVLGLGTIKDFPGLTTKHSISGFATKAAQVSGDPDGAIDVSRSVQTSWTFGTTAADTVNQGLSVIFTATKNTTTVLDLTGVLTSFVGDLLSTLTVIRYWSLEYLTTAQDATNGNASTGTVTVAPSAANPWITSPLGAAQVYTMKPGDKWFAEIHNATGWVVTAGTGDKLDFTHGDNVLDGIFRVTVLGNK